MEVNDYTTDIQTRAFEYAGYELLPEDFTVSAGITKTLVYYGRMSMNMMLIIRM
jgi:hypothetical protein